MRKFWIYIKTTPLNPLTLIVFFTIIACVILYLLKDDNNVIEYFFTCIGLGVSIAVVQCALIQNQIQKDNIKIELFDKRYSVFQSFLDSITIIKRDNWDRYILFKENDISRQMLQIEENMYKSVQLSFCLFDEKLCRKLIEANNAFSKVAESYKGMLIANLGNFTSQKDINEFLELLNTQVLSKNGFNTQEYEDALKKQFPKTYISIMNFNKECNAYLSFIDECGIIKDFRKYIFIDKLG